MIIVLVVISNGRVIVEVQDGASLTVIKTAATSASRSKALVDRWKRHNTCRWQCARWSRSGGVM